MKVKVIKLDDRYDFHSEEEKERVGKVFEALKYRNTYDEDERYHDFYALGLEDGTWHIPAICCEVVEEAINEEKQEIKPNLTNRILLVEDGSVDEEELEQLGIKYIVYRSSANKPEWL